MNNNLDLAAPGGVLGQQALAQMSSAAQRRTAKAIEEEQSRAIKVVTHEDARAFLTHRSVLTATALTALEEHCIQVAPLGEARYKTLVDAWTFGATKAIAEW